MDTSSLQIKSNSLPYSSTSKYWRYAYIALFIILMGCYIPTLARGVTFTDGPELLTAVMKLGTAHPTGYPLFTIFAHVFAKLIPFDVLPCIKVELFNALCGSLASTLVALAARTVLLQKLKSIPPAILHIACIAGGFSLGICPLLWSQVRIPEVYPFHVFLVSCALYCWSQFEISQHEKHIVLAALPMGMGLAHHVTMVYMLPASFVYILICKPNFFITWVTHPIQWLFRLIRKPEAPTSTLSGGWGFPIACLVGFLPLLSYGYLIWSTAHTDGVTWGNIDNWDALYNHMTGKQYQKFMHDASVEHLKRLAKIPDFFDKQFLFSGIVMFFAGVITLFVTSWRFAVFLLLYMALNIAHTVHYSVGDYSNYYLPAAIASSLFMCFGLAGLYFFLNHFRRQLTPWIIASALLMTAAICIYYYAKIAQRITAPLNTRGGLILAAILASISLIIACMVFWKRLKKNHSSEQSETASHTTQISFGMVVFTLLSTWTPVTIVRASEYYATETVGESYGAEVALNLPRGAVFLTQGDGFLFTMWYETHVLNRAVNTAILDVGNLRTAWYQKFVQEHYPAECDPLLPKFVLQPAQYQEECSTFRKRVDRHEKHAWSSMGLERARTQPQPFGSTKLPLLHGADPKCEDATFRKAHGNKECKCWEYEKKSRTLSEDCAYSPEEGAIVRRDSVEVIIQRIIEDHIDERPLFERNALTFWVGNVRDNQRNWKGPSYQRISADYALINRGRFNQIVHTEDISAHTSCSNESLSPIELRSLKPVQPNKKTIERRAYQPNEWPMLLSATFLTKAPSTRDDDASRTFSPSDKINMRFDWFEKNHYDSESPDHIGSKIRHGVKVCMFDPNGKRIAMKSTASTEKNPILFETSSEWPKGTYTIQACSVGEIWQAKLPLSESIPCQRTLLEYTFSLK